MNDMTPQNPFADRAVAETAGVRAMQAREIAELQTKYLMAERFPRDERRAMDGVINAFSRPGLAERAAYEYAKGGTAINGPSIHAAQAIAQQWGNMEFGFTEVERGIDADGVPFSTVRSFAIDLEHRTQRPIQFIVRHWRDTKSGGYRLKDERDIYELTANMAQRRTRACILSVLPQDVVDAAMAQAELTLKTKADTSPEAMTKMVEAFAPFGVTKEHIETLIQRRLDAITPAQVVRLKRIYASLRDDMSTPGEWFEMAPAGEGEGTPPPGQKTSAAEAVAARRAAKQKAAAEAAAAGAQAKAPATGPAPRTLAVYLAAIENSPDSDTAALVVDEARSVLKPDEQQQVSQAYSTKWQAPE
jgi:hypothetical protein